MSLNCANTTVHYELNSDDLKFLGVLASFAGFLLFVILIGACICPRPPPPPPPPPRVDQLEPTPGNPNQFICFAISGKGIDDGISSDYKERRLKSELALFGAELERMKMENQYLRDLLNQVGPSQ